jgi:hypothetical protein
VVKLQGKGGSNWQRLFLAMAYRRLGQRDRACGWFSKASLGEQTNWRQRLIYARLREQAAEVLEVAPKTSPP